MSERAPGPDTLEAARRLIRHFEWGRESWVGFVFTIAPPEAHLLQDRVEQWLAARDRTQLVLRPSSPEQLAGLVPTILGERGAACIWVEAVREDQSGETVWREAWVQLTLRLNERREALRAGLAGGLVFVAHPAMKPVIREAGPDLWSIRTRVFELSAADGEADLSLVGLTSLSDPGGGDRWSDEALLDDALAQWQRVRSTQAPEQQAETLLKLAQRSADVDRLEQATALAGEAVAILRQCSGPTLSLKFGEAVHSLGARLHVLGRVDEAITATAEAVEILRNSASATPDAHQLELANALHSLGAMLSFSGQFDAGILAVFKAVELYRNLVSAPSSTDFTTHHSLADALSSLGLYFQALGRWAEALDPVQEAVAIRRNLVDAAPDSIQLQADLGSSLRILAPCLENVGRTQEAIETAQEATDILRKQVNLRPGLYSALLGSSLMMLGYCLSVDGPTGTSIAAMREAIELYEPLFKTRPAVHREPLSRAYTSLGLHLASVGRPEEALTSLRRAVELFAAELPLNAHEKEAHLAALNRLAAMMATTDGPDQGLDVLQDAKPLECALKDVPYAATELKLTATLRQRLETESDPAS